jgi:WD40 repeat protein
MKKIYVSAFVLLLCIGNAINAVQKPIESWVQQLPTVLSTHIAQFLPQLSSPAPSLKRVRKSFIGSRELLGINNNGDQFYAARGDVDMQGQPILCLKNDAERKSVKSYLPDGWKLGYTFSGCHERGVYVLRQAANGDRMMGHYDVHTGSIQELGTCQDGDRIIAVNSQSAVIRGSDHLTYWISKNKQGLGEQRILLSHSNRYTYQNVRLDPVSNTVIWEHALLPGNLLIKDFDIAEDLLSLPVRSSKPDIRLFHNDGILVVTTGDDSATSHIVKICCYTKDKQWQLSITTSQNFSHPAIIRPIALSLPASVVLCTFQTQTQKKQDRIYDYKHYPAIMSLKTGAIVCDPLINDHGDVPGLFLSPNGRWIAGSTDDEEALLWEVRGLNLKPSCTFMDRFCLIEFKKIYDRAKERRAQYHLTRDQFELYNNLLENPDCEVPDEWITRFSTWKAILEKKIAKDPLSIVREYMGK